MKKIIAFDGSNNQHSINRKLLDYALSCIQKFHTEKILLINLQLPIYSSIEEKKNGVPPSIKQLYNKLLEADGFIIASPEHNSLVPAFFKNILDWLSRINFEFFKEKPLLLLSTSEGKNGGSSNLKVLSQIMPYWGANVLSYYSLPQFSQNFDVEEFTLKNNSEKSKLNQYLSELEQAL